MKKSKKTKPRHVSKNGIHLPTTIAIISGLVVFIFIPVLGKVYYAAQTERTVRATNKIKREIKNLNLEIKNLKLKKEQYSSWLYIEQKIREYNLNLKAPSPLLVRDLNKHEGIHWAAFRRKRITQANAYKNSSY